MADLRCPDCGAPISPDAVVCPACGFPIRPDALPLGGRPAGGSSSSSFTMIIVGLLVVGGLFAVVVIGILAAIAIPRFTQASERAKAKEGEVLLKRAYTAEQTWFAERGMYTSSVDSLGTILGHSDVAGPKRYTLEVSAASDRDLCLEAVPVPGTGVRALSMDGSGSLYRAAGCSGETDITVPVGMGGDEGARQMMREAYESITAYREANGGDNPRTLSDVVTRVHDSPAMGEYRFQLVRSDAQGVCAAVLPRNPLAGLHAYSVDQDGDLHQGAGCTGDAVEHFTSPAVDAGPAPGAGAAHAPDMTDGGEPAKREDKPLLPVERAP